MLELTNLKSNVDLNDKELKDVCGGAATFAAGTAITVGDIGIRALLSPSTLDSTYWATRASQLAIGTGVGYAFGGAAGAALES